MRWDTPAECQTHTFRKNDDHLTLHLVLRGRFEAAQDKARASVEPGHMLLVSDPGWVKRYWRDECEVFNLSINRQALDRVLASELGVDLMQPLKFDNLALARPAATATFARFIENLWLDLTQADSCFRNSHLSGHAERTLSLMLLQCFPHNYRHRFDEPAARGGAPFYVRRVQEYIHAHSSAALSFDDLLAVAGISARSLHYGFQASLGVTPMKYLKQVRLNQARDALAGSARTGETITSIALRCGYASLSRFSCDYKAFFGEGPAQSRRRG